VVYALARQGILYPPNPKPSRPSPDGHRDSQTSLRLHWKPSHGNSRSEDGGRSAKVVERIPSIKAGEPSNRANHPRTVSGGIPPIRGYREKRCEIHHRWRILGGPWRSEKTERTIRSRPFISDLRRTFPRRHSLRRLPIALPEGRSGAG